MKLLSVSSCVHTEVTIGFYLRVSVVSGICGWPVGVINLVTGKKKKKKRGSFWKISLKSVAIEMQGLFLREPSRVLFADGLPYVLGPDPYNLPQHPIWPFIALNSASAYLISFIINWRLCCKFTRAVLASRKCGLEWWGLWIINESGRPTNPLALSVTGMKTLSHQSEVTWLEKWRHL